LEQVLINKRFCSHNEKINELKSSLDYIKHRRKMKLTMYTWRAMSNRKQYQRRHHTHTVWGKTTVPFNFCNSSAILQ